jgi:hypothetical protein
MWWCRRRNATVDACRDPVFVGAWLGKRKQHLEAGRDGQSHKHAMFGLQHHYTATVLNSKVVRLCMRCCGEHAVET